VLQREQAASAVWAKYGGWKCLTASADDYNIITRSWLGADYMGEHRWNVASFQVGGGHRLFEVILNEGDGSMLLIHIPPQCEGKSPP
jgi:hypothetical protein